MATLANSVMNPDQLRAARAQFLDGLGPRLTTLGAMVDALVMKTEANGPPSARREAELEPLVRRLRAMRTAAETVGLDEIATAFDRIVASVPAAAHHELGVVKKAIQALSVVGQRALREEQARGAIGSEAHDPSSGDAPPLGPFTLVSLASESQRVILRQALQQAQDFHLHCTQDADEAAALLATYDPDMFVVDGRRSDALGVVARAEGLPVMVVDARAHDIERFRRAGAGWVTEVGEHYETQLLEGLRQARRSQSMIAPRGEGAVSLQALANEIADEVREALLDDRSGQRGSVLVSVGDGTQVRAAVWSMLARLRDTITDLTDGAVRYDPHTPDGAMIVTGSDAMRRGGRSRAAVENLRGRRVLVAEHDTSVGWYLTSLLRGKGAEVLEAQDGVEALRLARSVPPDLVICDVMLPEIDGFALCRNLKRDVVLSDVPVILLSWKEDLLQRVRELGAGADGYLAKEAEASVIVDRCAEALEPRARIEKRLREERVVHGRLDGVTPRLVLELASRIVDNARLTFQDAAFQYEVNVGDGRLLRARRQAKAGDVEVGERVLPGLLGMRAGRFVVERSVDHVQAELYGSLAKVIAPFVTRARIATRRLKGAELYEVARLELDTVALGPYIAVSPPIVGKLVEKLSAGVAPSELMQSVSAGLLESVLEDLALRGGVLRAFDGDGRDLLEGGAEEASSFDAGLAQAGRSEAGRSEAGRSEAGPDWLKVAPASGAPLIGSDSTPDEVDEAAEFAERANISTRPTTRPPSSAAASRAVIVPGPANTGAAEPERRSSIPPSDARTTVLGLAPEAPRPERPSQVPQLPQASLVKEQSDEPAPVQERPSVHPSEAVTPPSGTAWSLASDPLAAALSATPAATEIETSIRDYQSPMRPAAPRSDRPSEATQSLASVPQGAWQDPGLGGWTPLEAKRSTRARAGRLTSDQPAPNPTQEGGSAPDAIDLSDMVAAGMSATPLQPEVAPELPSRRVDPVLRPSVRVRSGASSSDTESQEGGQTLTGIGSPSSLPAPAPAEVNVGGEGWKDTWRAPFVEGSVIELEREPSPVVWRSEQAGSAPTPSGIQIPVRSLQPPEVQTPVPQPVRPASPAPRAMPRQETTAEIAAHAGLPKTLLSSDRAAAWMRSVTAAAKPVAIVGVAAVGAFLGMNQLAGWFAPQHEVATQTLPARPAETTTPSLAAQTPADDLVQAEDLAISPPGSEQVAHHSEVTVTDLPLPEGLSVGEGKGLLEVDTGGQHKLYIGDVFVGRGPMRRIPIDPGQHRVIARLDGVDESHEVTVVAGRRVRVQFVESAR